ncbi:hypothetical protein Tco_0283782 [Tanacetum coccineum]
MQPVAPPSLDYMPGPEHPSSPDYVSGPKHPPSPVNVPYVPEPEYPEYLVPSNVEAPLEDQPLPADALPTALSPDYVADSDPNKDPKEDPEENHADYPTDGGDGDDEPSNDDDEDEEPFEDEDDDEAAPILVPSPRRHTARMSVKPQTPILLPSEAEVKRLLTLPIPPPSPLSPWSSPLPKIP